MITYPSKPGAGGTTAAFSSVEEQRAHFRSDWHRFNVRRKLHGRAVFTEDEFERSVQDDGELSSLSGSDSDSEDESDTARLGSHAATSTSHRSSEVIFVSGTIACYTLCILAVLARLFLNAKRLIILSR